MQGVVLVGALLCAIAFGQEDILYQIENDELGLVFYNSRPEFKVYPKRSDGRSACEY